MKIGSQHVHIRVLSACLGYWQHCGMSFFTLTANVLQFYFKGKFSTLIISHMQVFRCWDIATEIVYKTQLGYTTHFLQTRCSRAVQVLHKDFLHWVHTPTEQFLLHKIFTWQIFFGCFSFSLLFMMFGLEFDFVSALVAQRTPPPMSKNWPIFLPKLVWLWCRKLGKRASGFARGKLFVDCDKRFRFVNV